MQSNQTTLQVRSVIRPEGLLAVSLARVPLLAPADDEVVVRIEGAPINPSDLRLLLGGADLSTLAAAGSDERPVLIATMTPGAASALDPRRAQATPVGNEGAGVVVAAGRSPQAQSLVGKSVAMLGGAMYAQHRTIAAADVMVLPDDLSPADGASAFVNPLTALGMVETMKREGHTGLVHTAAASNLGQMLVKLCLADAIALVNIVRTPEQAQILRDLGAQHVCDSTAPGFREHLITALQSTRATLAFDAIGGGRLVSQILDSMETAAIRNGATVTPYGSTVRKQAYLYGALDVAPTKIFRSFGMYWGVGGWILSDFVQKTQPARLGALRARIASELKGVFASRYTRQISLAELLQPEIARAYARRATGEKYLLNPSL